MTNSYELLLQWLGILTPFIMTVTAPVFYMLIRRWVNKLRAKMEITEKTADNMVCEMKNQIIELHKKVNYLTEWHNKRQDKK